MADRAVKQPLDLLPVFCLPQYPHQLGYGGFGGHIVGFQYIQSGFQAVPHVIQQQVAAFIGTCVVITTVFPAETALLITS